VDFPIKIAIFHSYVKLPEGNSHDPCFLPKSAKSFGCHGLVVILPIATILMNFSQPKINGWV
jgi:hypothetical protein